MTDGLRFSMPNSFARGNAPLFPGDSHEMRIWFLAVLCVAGGGRVPAIGTKYRTDDDPWTGIERTRALCRYPGHAVYSGSGSPDDAASYVCTEER